MGLSFGQRDASSVRKGDGALLGPAPRRTQVVPAPDGIFDSLVVLISPDCVELPRGFDSKRTGLVTATDRGSLSAYLLFLGQELMRPGSAIHAPSALQAAGALVAELYAATVRAGLKAESVRSAGLNHVIRAEEIMRSRLDEPLTVGTLASELGVGTRALQAAFRAHRSMSPREVLTAMRLDEAQRHLLSARPEESVTSIALNCGFAHLSRFSEAYRYRFGELPSETLARVRRDLPHAT
jgi:AraC-like DNA-binding protein